jgi:hypothetical protein
MSKPRPGLVAVDSGLVGQTLVEAVLSHVLKLAPPDPPGAAGEALDDPDLSLAAPDEGRLEMRLRRAGYLARVAEAELFDPATSSRGARSRTSCRAATARSPAIRPT